jgi:hypothetical protein
LGREENFSMYFRYSSAFSKSGSVSGVSCDIVKAVERPEEQAAEAEAVKARDCLVEITKRKRTEEGAHMLVFLF